MKLIGKVSLAAVLAFGLFQPAAYAEETGFASKCEKYGKLITNVDPSPQQMNCLLTNAALAADIPPEVVKAVASQENGDWKHYGERTKDGGIGIMQVTNHPEYDQDQLKNDVVYNIKMGVDILSKLFNDSSLPKVKGANRDSIENWYFPAMAYNGTYPVNSPLIQANGMRNEKAYQEEVFKKIMTHSYANDTALAKFPFTTSDFQYNPASNQKIQFPTKEYEIQEPLHSTAYKFKAGDKVMTTTDGTNIRNTVESTAGANKASKNDVLIITGDFVYHSNRANHFVFYPVKAVKSNVSGFVSSAYITALIDTEKPVISGADNKVTYMGSAFNPLRGIVASDNADGNVINQLKVEGKVNIGKKGKYSLTYTVTDSSGNTQSKVRVITVADKTKPVISGAGFKEIKRYSSFNPKTGVTAKDNADGDVTKRIKVVKNPVNTKKKGTYTVVYSVNDLSNNKAEVRRTIRVK